MLRFKQFLILEDTTISTREHLEAVYGKEKAAEMIAKIREREQQKGSAEDHADKFVPAFEDELYDKTTGLRRPSSDRRADIEKELADKFHLDNDTMRTADRFSIPIYSDTNLDKRIDVQVKDAKDMYDPKYGLEYMASGQPAGDKYSRDRGTRPVIAFNKNYDISKWADRVLTSYGKYVGKGKIDTVGHEATHTMQPDYAYNTSKNELGKTEYNSDKPASPETLKRREYTQNALEPAARMSELKHIYFQQSNKLLKADMAPEEKEAFKSWYNDSKNGVRTPDFDDTMQLVDTPEGDELLRRTAKVTKPNTSNTGIA